MNKKTLNLPLFALLAICFSIAGCQKGSSDPEYHIIRPDFTPEYNTYALTPGPLGINMTYYNDIYSRGFAWITDTDADDTELYLVKSDQGAAADFSNAELISGTCEERTNSSMAFNSHKVHVENLEKGKAYSYKIGSSLGYAYGAFIVEKDQPESITAIQLSDAQTLDPTKLNVWRNTFVKAVETAGDSLDTVLYNGDQFDQNMERVNGSSVNRILRYSKALDVISDYKFNIAYMPSSGNHETSISNVQYIMNDIEFAKYESDGAYYSYDYNFAHFVVLNSNDMDDEQVSWLTNDLESASSATWKIVMLHHAPYSTGDHSDASANRTLVEKLTPIFASKHVDLVLQAHDHTYNKTLPYLWGDNKGYTTNDNDTNIVNFNPAQKTYKDKVYDENPNGTYYVTTGAAGHRCGEEEEDGIYAEAIKDESGAWKGLNPSKTFLSSKYKHELGKLTESNQYTPYTFGNYTSNQNYQAGDIATGNVNAQMFGVLSLSKNTLNYDAYTVNSDTVKLFDTLNVYKS